MRAVLLLLLGLLVGLGHCGQAVIPERNPLLGKYVLQARDYDGKAIFDGTLSIDTFENGRIKGQCTLTNVNANLGFGKDGPWEGEVSGEEIVLDLAPQLDDAGMTLEGHWREGYISGTVTVESFAGGRHVGTFEAQRQ